MLSAVRSRWKQFGLLYWIFVVVVDGLIEIVEEQRCHDYEFRLTCRELDSYIAVLEAWYTTLEDHHRISNTTRPQELRIKTENDSELNQVYVYSSPKHNGVYITTNHSIDNVTSDVNTTFEEYRFLNDSLVFFNDSGVSEGKSEGCGVMTFGRSYGSSREGDKRRRTVDRSSSVNLRSPLSYRCTGVNHCRFLLEKDYPPSVSWEPGVVNIKYACFDNFVSLKYCNREVRISPSGSESEGYIRTPGYPNFYVGEECRWRLVVHPEQRVQITLLDVSLRSIGPFEDHCADFLSVEDSSGHMILSSCEQVDLPLRLTSNTDSVEVLVKVISEGAYPKRGVLLHYKSVGCVTIAEPPNGYLVYRNKDVAHYLCHPNFVFDDTRQRARFIWCYDDNRWNDTVPLCVAESSLWAPIVAESEETSPTAVGNDLTKSKEKDAKLPHNEANMIVDIVIPVLLIAALFIGNAFIVLIIHKYRKRKHEDLDDEFNTIPLNANGNLHSVGNAV